MHYERKPILVDLGFLLPLVRVLNYSSVNGRQQLL